MDPKTTRDAIAGEPLFCRGPAPFEVRWARELAPVSAFCDEHGLRRHAETALQLAREAFPEAKRVTVSAENESDPSAACLVIDVATGLGPDESLRRHGQFARKWIEAAPPEIAERISLTLDVT